MDDHRDELSPCYSWFIRDWRASHRAGKLSWKERGFYRECLDWSWDLNGLPHDKEAIRDLLGATKGDFVKLWPAAAQFYVLAPDGRLKNARQEAERIKQHRRRDLSSKGGATKAGSSGSAPPAVPHGSAARHNQPAVPDGDADPTALHLHLPLPVPLLLQTHTARGSPVNIEKAPAEAIAERAGRFCERYGELYAQLRRGARYLPRPALDFQKACDLCAVWDSERLERLATVFLKTDHDFAASGSRTIGQFAALASWCDDRLREVEAQHAV